MSLRVLCDVRNDINLIGRGRRRVCVAYLGWGKGRSPTDR
jgi:hypothetical protein